MSDLSFTTLRGWDGEWDDPNSLLVCKEPLNFQGMEILLGIFVEKSGPITWMVELLACSPEGVDTSLLDASFELSYVDPYGVKPENKKMTLFTSLVDYGASALLMSYRHYVPRKGVMEAKAEAHNVFEKPAHYLDDNKIEIMKGFL